MLTIAALLLALAALGGLTAAFLRYRSGSNPPMQLSLIHGAAGAAGLVLAIAAGFADEFTSRHTIAVALLVIAALGGFVLFGTHLRDRLISLPVIGIHALVAVAGYVTLLSVVFS